MTTADIAKHHALAANGRSYRSVGMAVDEDGVEYEYEDGSWEFIPRGLLVPGTNIPLDEVVAAEGRIGGELMHQHGGMATCA